MTDPSQLAFVFLIGFAWGGGVMGWLYERRERKRQERYWRRLLGEDLSAPPFRNPCMPMPPREPSASPPSIARPYRTQDDTQ